MTDNANSPALGGERGAETTGQEPGLGEDVYTGFISVECPVCGTGLKRPTDYKDRVRQFYGVGSDYKVFPCCQNCDPTKLEAVLLFMAAPCIFDNGIMFTVGWDDPVE